MKLQPTNEIEVLIAKEELKSRVKSLGETISRDYEGKTLTLICVLKGGVVFLSDLARAIKGDVELDFMDISSYSGTESSGIVKISMDLKTPITDKHVLLVEDIIDTGRSLSHVAAHLSNQKPASLRICTLLDKPDRRVVDDIHPEYIGFTIPDKFVIGYGLDYNQKYRTLDFIGILDPKYV